MKLSLPLLKDNHNHTFTYAALCNFPNLINISTKIEAVKIIKGQNAPVNIILGWNDSKYNFDEKELAGFPPLIICNLSLHRYLINQPARKILREKSEEIINNIENQAWVEKNLRQIVAFVASLSEFSEKNIDSFFNDLEKAGVWYAEDMLVSDARIIKYYVTSKYHNRTAVWTDIGTYKTLSDNLRKEIKGIKIFLDGAIGAMTAALSTNYKSGGEGLLLHSNDELMNLLSSIADVKKPVAIHAIGDRAIDQAANALEKIRCNGQNLEARIEHCQFISKKTAIKLKNLGVILSMQPNFTDDSVQYVDRLPAQFLNLNNPFRMLVDEVGFEPGKDLIFGSDGMPHGVKFALKQSLFPPYENQRLKIEEFIAGYCMPDRKNGSIDVEIDEKNKDIKI